MNTVRIGIDEAGYGPTLGPLVIASVQARLPNRLDDSLQADLWTELAPVCRKSNKGQKNSIWVYDSKVIKSGSKGYEDLETGILAFYCINNDWPETLGALLTGLGTDLSFFAEMPWYSAIQTQKIPVFAWKQDIIEKSERLSKKLSTCGMTDLKLQSRVFGARQFNAGVRKFDNKATFHLDNISQLITDNLTVKAENDIDVRCDKLGGRSKYIEVLKALFPEQPIRILEEGRAVSRYRLEKENSQLQIQFQQKADQHNFLTALASMICKYLREVFVKHLNAYFQSLQPGLKKTAGYPQDAKRFLADIADQSFVADDLIRCR